MNRDTLVRMANQIGTFFQSQPDHNEALEGLASHIARSWEPRMRREFDALLKEGGPQAQAVLPIVREALDKHRTLLA
jgi:formate dehydrogenase subunit delta